MLAEGLRAQLEYSGRLATTNNGEVLTVLIQDVAALADPAEIARAKVPVYSTVQCLATSAINPRTVTRFTDCFGRVHNVIRYEEKVGDGISFNWFCESVRA